MFSGQYVTQSTGYKAFIPTPLPPALKIEGALQQLLSDANFESSYQTIQGLINEFVESGILKEVTGKKRGRRYTFWEYIDCLSEGTK